MNSRGLLIIVIGFCLLEANHTLGDTDLHRVAEARNAFGVNGAGVTVGVLSSGIEDLAAVQAAGKLPTTIQVLPGQEGFGNTGTAMLEIVHNLAPGAALMFSTAFPNQTTMAENIRALAAAGCDIIVDDVSYFAEPVFQDGIIAQAITDVKRQHDVLYFSAIMNKGRVAAGTASVWEGRFVDSGIVFSVPGGKSGVLHDYAVDRGGDTHNDVLAASPFPTVLQWADPFGQSGNDYDLCIIDSQGNVECSADVQDGDDDPIEFVRPAQPGDRIVIIKAAQAESRFLHLDTFGSGSFRQGQAQAVLEHGTDGAIAGHAGSEDVVAVAALRTLVTEETTTAPFASVARVMSLPPFSTLDSNELTDPFADDPSIEVFSSDGPRRVFFDVDGNPLSLGSVQIPDDDAPVVRQKPDIAAADGVTTSSPDFDPFFGTSASAPHAAAVAALMKELGNGNSLSPPVLDDFSQDQGFLLGESTGNEDRKSNETTVNGLTRVMEVSVSGNGSKVSAEIKGGSFNTSFENGSGGLGVSDVSYRGLIDTTNGGKTDSIELTLKDKVTGSVDVTLFVVDADGFSGFASLTLNANSDKTLSFKLTDFQFFGDRGPDFKRLVEFFVSLAALNPGKSTVAIDQVGMPLSDDSSNGSEPNSADEIRRSLVDGATDIGPFGSDINSGAGVLDATNALGQFVKPSNSFNIPFSWEVDLNADDVFASFGPDDQPVRSQVQIQGRGTGSANSGFYRSTTDQIVAGDPLTMEAFVDMFYDVTFTDVDPNRDYASGLGSSVVLEDIRSVVQTTYTGIADSNLPNFGLFSQATGWDWLRDTSIPIAEGKTLFIPSTRLRTRLQLQIPDPNNEIFTDGFESGDTASWTSSPPFEVKTRGTLTIRETQVIPARE